MDYFEAASSLWTVSDLPSTVLSRLRLGSEPDPSVNSSFRLGTAAQVRVLLYMINPDSNRRISVVYWTVSFVGYLFP